MKNLSIFIAILSILTISVSAQDNIFAPDKNRVIDTDTYHQWYMANIGDTARDSFDYQFALQANRVKFALLTNGFKESSIDRRLDELKQQLKAYYRDRTGGKFILVLSSSVIPIHKQLFNVKVLEQYKEEPMILLHYKGTFDLPDSGLYAVDYDFVPIDYALEKNRLSTPKIIQVYHREKIKRINVRGVVVRIKRYDRFGKLMDIVPDTLWGEDWCLRGEYFKCVPDWAQHFFDDKKKYGGVTNFDYLEKYIPPYATYDTTWERESVLLGHENFSYFKADQAQIYAAAVWHCQERERRHWVLALLTGSETLKNLDDFKYYDFSGNENMYVNAKYGQGDYKKFFVITGKKLP